MARDKDKHENESSDEFLKRAMDEHFKSLEKNYKMFKGKRYMYSTGVLPLDYYINHKTPGIVGGNIIQAAGEGHSGKTVYALNIIRIQLAKGHKVVYIDQEGGLTDELLALFGITKYGTPNFIYVPAHQQTDKQFNLVKDLLMYYQGMEDPYVIVLDSMTYFRPPVENFESVRVGDNIPYFNNFLRAVLPLIGNTNGLMILLNGVYDDNKNQYNDYIISGGKNVNRASALITLHYKRANDTSPTADQDHEYNFGKGLSLSYRQKLELKIVKNKWSHVNPKFAKLEVFFNLDPRFGPTGLDNNHAMLHFLKMAGVLVGGASLSLGEHKMRWKDWEAELRKKDSPVRQLVIEKTEETLNKFFNEIPTD